MNINNTDDIRFAYSVLANIDFLTETKMVEENGMLVYSLTLIAERQKGSLTIHHQCVRCKYQ